MHTMHFKYIEIVNFYWVGAPKFWMFIRKQTLQAL